MCRWFESGDDAQDHRLTIDCKLLLVVLSLTHCSRASSACWRCSPAAEESFAGFDPRAEVLRNVCIVPIPGGLTGFAASLGASFWFDTLQRFVRVRAPREKPQQSKKSS
jgi:hypothetical protein